MDPGVDETDDASMDHSMHDMDHGEDTMDHSMHDMDRGEDTMDHSMHGKDAQQ
jgi:hypothetical protein